MSETEFKDIVLNHQDRVYSTCLGFLKNQEDAEDIAQEVFIQVYKSYDTFLSQSNLSTWIYRIAVNKCLEELRKRKSAKRDGNHSSIDNSLIPNQSYDHPGLTLENKERASILMEAIGQLPEHQQTAFTLSKIEGLSYDEIGKIMNKSISSIESLLHRSKTSLRQLLRKYYEEN